MIMRMGNLCKMCNIIFKDQDVLLSHFVKEHRELTLVKLEEFTKSESYLDDERDNNKQDPEPEIKEELHKDYDKEI